MRADEYLPRMNTRRVHSHVAFAVERPAAIRAHVPLRVLGPPVVHQIREVSEHQPARLAAVLLVPLEVSVHCLSVGDDLVALGALQPCNDWRSGKTQTLRRGKFDRGAVRQHVCLELALLAKALTAHIAAETLVYAAHMLRQFLLAGKRLPAAGPVADVNFLDLVLRHVPLQVRLSLEALPAPRRNTVKSLFRCVEFDVFVVPGACWEGLVANLASIATWCRRCK